VIAALTIWNKRLSYAALVVATIALPFSVKICHASIIVFLIAWMTEGSWKSKLRKFSQNKYLQILVAFAVLTLVGALYSSDQTSACLAIERKVFFVLLPLAIATTLHPFTNQQIRVLFYCFTAALFFGSIMCLFFAYQQLDGTQSFHYLSTTNFDSLYPDIGRFWLSFSYVSLSAGIDLHPTFFSLYVNFAIAFLLWNLRTQQLPKFVKAIHWSLSIYFSIFLICLSSRINIICFFILIALLVSYDVYCSQKKHAITMACLSGLLIAMLYFNPVSRYRNTQELAWTNLDVTPNTDYKTSIAIRLSLWWTAVKSLNPSNLLAGVGAGDVESIMKQTASKYLVTNVLQSHDPHNQYLYTLLSNGVIGLGLLVILMFFPAWIAIRNQDYLYLYFTFVFAGVLLTESGLELQKGIAFYSIINSVFLFWRSEDRQVKHAVNL
jgi:O-antigen ligase